MALSKPLESMQFRICPSNNALLTYSGHSNVLGHKTEDTLLLLGTELNLELYIGFE